MKLPSKQSLILITLGVIIILTIGIFVLQNQPQEVIEVPEEQGENVENASEQVDTANWQAYRNEEYGFEVKVPEEWSIEKGESSMFTIKRDPIDSNNKLYFTVSIERSNKDPQFWFADNVEDPKINIMIVIKS